MVRAFSFSEKSATIKIENNNNDMAKIISIINQKGGVGKTTITFDTARSKKKSFGSDTNYQSGLSLRQGAFAFLGHLKNTRFVTTIFYFLFLEEPLL